MAKAKQKKKEPRRALAIGATAMDILPPEVETVALAKGLGATVNGLVVTGAPTFEAWSKALDTLRVVEKGAQFAIGDALNYGEDRFGEQASQAIDPSHGWSLKTIENYKWIAKRVPPESRRMDRLGIRHHQLVAALSPAKQRQWLTEAAAEGEESPWTVARFAAALREGADVTPTAWWILVVAADEADQRTLQEQIEAMGRSCKAVVRRRQKK